EVLVDVWHDYSCVIAHGRFFFQAEDGIRDRNVTGVQTCALPIFFLGFAGMFRVLGVQYDSNWALILFVVLFFVIGFFFDFIFRVLTNLTKRYMSDQRISFSITFLFNLIKNGLVLFLLDDLMRS